MDLIFIPLGTLLWWLMTLLAKGLERLRPKQGGRS